MNTKIHNDQGPGEPVEFWAVIDTRTNIRCGMAVYRTEVQALDAIRFYKVLVTEDMVIYDLLPFLAAGPVLFDEDDDYVDYIAYL